MERNGNGRENGCFYLLLENEIISTYHHHETAVKQCRGVSRDTPESSTF
jgi:hypothetical protein